MELLKLLSTNEIVAQIVNFLILFFLLRAFAWKKILGLLDARREKIAADLAGIEKAQNAAEALRRDYEAKIASIEEEAKAKIQEAVIQGKALAEEIKQGAHAEAQRIIRDAREDIRREISVAREKMKEEIVDLALRAAEQVFEERIVAGDDSKLVRRFIDDISVSSGDEH